MKYIYLKDPISVLPLSKRLRNCLLHSGIQTIGEMITYPKKNNWEIIPNMGKNSIEEVNQWIDDVRSQLSLLTAFSRQ